ncbi:MAG: hypothetical protein RLP44_23835 [Aggregatilineales bacterium]
MDMNTANQMMNEAGKLVELSAIFQVNYGRGAQLKPGSPEDEWTLYNLILNVQSRIARMMDETCLEANHHKFGAWWKRQDVMDVATAQAVIQEIGTLIARCAYLQTDSENMTQTEQLCYALNVTQSTIAGMLHPASLQIAADKSIAFEELKAS